MEIFVKVASPSVSYATQSTEPHFVDANTTSGVSKSENIRQNTSEMNVSRRVHIFKKISSKNIKYHQRYRVSKLLVFGFKSTFKSKN